MQAQFRFHLGKYGIKEMLCRHPRLSAPILAELVRLEKLHVA